MPRPVTTTRLICVSLPRCRIVSRCCARIKSPSSARKRQGSWRPAETAQSVQRRNSADRLSALCVLFEKFDRVTDGQNSLGGIIRYLTAKFFLKCHHELDGVETVSTKIIDEARILGHLVGLYPEMLDHNFLNPLANVAHRSTSR